MKLYQLKCPSCNSTLTVEEGRNLLFCQYCGTRIALDDGVQRTEYTLRDEAKIREAEAYERVRMKELELEQEWQANRKRSMGIWWRICLAATVVGGLSFFVLYDGLHIKYFDAIGAGGLIIGVYGFVFGGVGYFVSLITHNSKKRNR